MQGEAVPYDFLYNLCLYESHFRHLCSAMSHMGAFSGTIGARKDICHSEREGDETTEIRS